MPARLGSEPEGDAGATAGTMGPPSEAGLVI